MASRLLKNLHKNTAPTIPIPHSTVLNNNKDNSEHCQPPSTLLNQNTQLPIYTAHNSRQTIDCCVSDKTIRLPQDGPDHEETGRKCVKNNNATNDDTQPGLTEICPSEGELSNHAIQPKKAPKRTPLVPTLPMMILPRDKTKTATLTNPNDDNSPHEDAVFENKDETQKEHVGDDEALWVLTQWWAQHQPLTKGGIPTIPPTPNLHITNMLWSHDTHNGTTRIIILCAYQDHEKEKFIIMMALTVPNPQTPKTISPLKNWQQHSHQQQQPRQWQQCCHIGSKMKRIAQELNQWPPGMPGDCTQNTALAHLMWGGVVLSLISLIGPWQWPCNLHPTSVGPWTYGAYITTSKGESNELTGNPPIQFTLPSRQQYFSNNSPPWVHHFLSNNAHTADENKDKNDKKHKHKSNLKLGQENDSTQPNIRWCGSTSTYNKWKNSFPTIHPSTCPWCACKPRWTPPDSRRWSPWTTCGNPTIFFHLLCISSQAKGISDTH